ncbi:hypothetical protein PAXINDRAFT_152771 [Paxillus involutus ATCC 200175]|nr:hypothetical protein PAXINDRAFT_152771 [Paxillus involutus ATCC 200175]
MPVTIPPPSTLLACSSQHHLQTLQLDKIYLKLIILAQLYKHNILLFVTNAAPPLIPADPAPIPDIHQIVQDAIQQVLQPIHQCLEGMEQQLGEMNQCLDGVQETLREMQGTLSKKGLQLYLWARTQGQLFPSRSYHSILITVLR